MRVTRTHARPTSNLGQDVRVAAMPIHIRAEPGDYAEAVLLPGDPLRAKYIADTYLDEVVQTNSERGMLGFRGSWEGKPVSVQATGMGCPSVAMEAAILFTLGALRKVQAGCLLIVSDIVVEGEFTRITDDEMRAAVDRMTRVALA